MKKVLFINMPFATLEHPSLALSQFKSRFINEGIPCCIEYLNILFAEMIGWENYSFIVQLPSIFAGERLFARILFGNQIPEDEKYFNEVVLTSGLSYDVAQRLDHIKSYVEPFLKLCLERIPWPEFDIIAFSSLFEQNIACLALAYYIKQFFPNKIIVLGGANCEGIMGITLHKYFSYIDFVCIGEADNSFPELIKRLSYGHPVDDLKGIVYRDGNESIFTGKNPIIEDLNSLPMPNYDDYFQRIMNSPIKSYINPVPLFETSRGCWWGEKGQCTFCGLNGENAKFRSKSAERIINEILYLTNRYNTRFLRSVDNVLNRNYFDDLLPELTHMGLNLQIIFEVRVNLKKNQVKMLSDAGINIIQAGIENLSTHILKLMNKGATSLKNIQFLKWCKQYNVLADWNIIYGFPGETAEDYKECLLLVKKLTHLNHPTGFGPIRMDRFSPNFNKADEKGFVNIRPLRLYKYLYPFNDNVLFDMLYYFDFDYKEKINDPGYLTQLNEIVWHWKNKMDSFYGYEAEDSLILYDSRPVAFSPQWILRDTYKKIYEYCDSIRRLNDIERWLKTHCKVTYDTEKIENILTEFVNKNLMVKEKDSYLSLAVLTYEPDISEKSLR